MAEDEQTVRTVVYFILKSTGYNVIVADDGLDGLTKAREYKGEIHCVLADVIMPRMTGIELATQLLRDRPEIRVLVMSALSSRAVGLQEGWQFLQKPFTMPLLKDKLRALLQEEPDRGSVESSGAGCSCSMEESRRRFAALL